MTAKQNLHAKLAEIRGDLNGQIRKTGEHTQGGPQYKFVEALEVGRQFVEKASALGITMLPEAAWVVNVRPTASGKQTVISIKVDWRVTDSESGETLVVTSFGEGADNSDKALPKAQTNAMKYAILMLLQAAGDDPEKDEPEAPYRRNARRTATRRNARAADREATGDDPVGDDEPLSPPRRNRAAEQAENDEAFDDAMPVERPARRRPRRTDPEPVAGPEMASSNLKAKIRARQHEVGLTDDQFRAFGFHFTGKTSSKEWTTGEAEKVLARLDSEAVVEEFRGMRPHKED